MVVIVSFSLALAVLGGSAASAVPPVIVDTGPVAVQSHNDPIIATIGTDVLDDVLSEDVRIQTFFCYLIARNRFDGTRASTGTISGSFGHSTSISCEIDMQRVNTQSALLHRGSIVSADEDDCTFVPLQQRCHAVLAGQIHNCAVCNGGWRQWGTFLMDLFPGFVWISSPEDEDPVHWECDVDHVNGEMSCAYIGDNITLS